MKKIWYEAWELALQEARDQASGRSSKLFWVLALWPVWDARLVLDAMKKLRAR